MERTIKEIGELLNIEDPNEVRGLVKFLVNRRLLVEKGSREALGRKGKRATLYVLNDGVTEASFGVAFKSFFHSMISR